MGCGILTPWNFPLAMITRKLGAAIATGCTAVIKPASEHHCRYSLGILAEEAGFPPGVDNVLPSADASGLGKYLTEHPLIKKYHLPDQHQ